MQAKELLAYLVDNLVVNKEDVVIDVDETENSINLTLRVNPDDMGRVIGRKGRIANSIRTILKAANFESTKNVNLEIAD
ncbi:KH domain-containing protein [Ezakiella massiliensis]|uniref:KH domain-containing protein n=1 Tax=Ezakiella massiliensis TaxID=1852374 RepID=UPI00094EDF59|nr:KH domain-containing protein [Ezakiella massiliensis]